ALVLRADALDGCLEGSKKRARTRCHHRCDRGLRSETLARGQGAGRERVGRVPWVCSACSSGNTLQAASAPRCRWLYDAPALLPSAARLLGRLALQVGAPISFLGGRLMLPRGLLLCTLPRPSRPAARPRTPCVSSRGTQSPRQRAALGHAGGDQVPDGGSDGGGIEHGQLLVLGVLLFCLLASTCGLSTKASAASRKQLTNP